MVAVRSRTFTTRVGGARVRGQRAEVYLSEYYELIKVLREVDSDLLKEFRKKSKALAKPVQQDIRDSIPSTAPIRGMRRRVVPGRLTWGVGKPAKSALIRTKNPRKFDKRKSISLASVAVRSPATILADMAGKSNRVTGKTKITKRYAYSRAKSGFRTHRINGQGENMIRALNAKANASRFVWPGAEKSLPAVRQEFQTVVDDVVLRVNAELERKNGL